MLKLDFLVTFRWYLYTETNDFGQNSVQRPNPYCQSMVHELKIFLLVELFSSMFLWNFLWFSPPARKSKMQWRDGLRFLTFFIFFAKKS